MIFNILIGLANLIGSIMLWYHVIFRKNFGCASFLLVIFTPFFAIIYIVFANDNFSGMHLLGIAVAITSIAISWKSTSEASEKLEHRNRIKKRILASFSNYDERLRLSREADLIIYRKLKKIALCNYHEGYIEFLSFSELQRCRVIVDKEKSKRIFGNALTGYFIPGILYCPVEQSGKEAVLSIKLCIETNNNKKPIVLLNVLSDKVIVNSRAYKKSLLRAQIADNVISLLIDTEIVN